VSNSDSFIDEVNEEVRRDKLYGLLRRYGWIAITVVVLLVAGAGVNEWLKAQANQKAEALGDGMLAALEAETPEAQAEALAALEAEGDAAILVKFITAERALFEDDTDSAVAALAEIAGTDGIDPLYRDLAVLGQVMAEGDARDAAERLTALDPLTAPGGAFRLLALEQQALIRAETGETDQALAILQDILADQELTPGLRLRATQLIVALGGELEAG